MRRTRTPLLFAMLVVLPAAAWAGDLFILEITNPRVLRMNRRCELSLFATLPPRSSPRDIEINRLGELFIPTTGRDRGNRLLGVTKVDPQGRVSFPRIRLGNLHVVDLNERGDLFAAMSNGQIFRWNAGANGSPDFSTESLFFSVPFRCCPFPHLFFDFDSRGNLITADQIREVLHIVDDQGTARVLTTYSVQREHLRALWIAPGDRIFMSTGPGNLYEIDSTGRATRFASGIFFLDPEFDSRGRLIGVADNSDLIQIEPDGRVSRRLPIAGQVVDGVPIDLVRGIAGGDLPPCLLQAAIDVKPDDSENTVNPRARGVLPVAILTTTEGEEISALDAAEIDPGTVRLHPGDVPIAHPPGHLEDVDGDGDPDLLVHFSIADSAIACETTSVRVEGDLRNGDPFEGADAIRTVGCPGGRPDPAAR